MLHSILMGIWTNQFNNVALKAPWDDGSIRLIFLLFTLLLCAYTRSVFIKLSHSLLHNVVLAKMNKIEKKRSQPNFGILTFRTTWTCQMRIKWSRQMNRFDQQRLTSTFKIFISIHITTLLSSSSPTFTPTTTQKNCKKQSRFEMIFNIFISISFPFTLLFFEVFWSYRTTETVQKNSHWSPKN